MFQDHVVDENSTNVRLGRVLGCQAAFMIAKTGTTIKNTETIEEIGPMLVSGALDRTKKFRKASADIFAKFWS